MDIKRNGSQPSTKGPEDYFTGTVRIDPLFQTSDPARSLGASVTFVNWMEKVRDAEYFAYQKRR